MLLDGHLLFSLDRCSTRDQRQCVRIVHVNIHARARLLLKGCVAWNETKVGAISEPSAVNRLALDDAFEVMLGKTQECRRHGELSGDSLSETELPSGPGPVIWRLELRRS
ncbi:hypothetical protein GWK47_045922 [Chionoecetes opilio]|uniref:Uncharacterized protein n=1 Tax=Chionoecetes opilio TaxID=41210 RepID=A0A8J5CV08_CHIOP|nr:hypothetical protein GWK47_045922 [Chionoecetes opilio]